MVPFVRLDPVSQYMVVGGVRAESGGKRFQPYQTNSRWAVGGDSYMARAHCSALRRSVGSAATLKALS